MVRGKDNHIPGKNGEADFLSKLPDDILLMIQEQLDICVLLLGPVLVSTQWRHVPTMLHKIIIKVTSFHPDKDDRSNITLGDLVRANIMVHEATKSPLSSRRNAGQYALDLLYLQFYQGNESIHIAQTAACTMEKQTIDSVEFTILTMKGHADCTEDDVLFHGRQLMSLFEACPNAFGGLTRLKLENMSLNESELPNIFSICKRLEFLRMYNCDMGILSSLVVEHSQLSELEMDHCRFERVHLKWLPKLTMLTFENWISQQDPLTFGYVPLLSSLSLTNIAFSWHKMLELSKFLGNATISSLQLNFKSEKIWIQPEGPKQLLHVFHNLRLVNLINVSEECDLNWTMFILQGAPSLEELHIMVRDHSCEMLTDEEPRKEYAYSDNKDIHWKADTSCFKHYNLSVLKIFGFRPEDKFIRYIRSVLEAAVNLVDIFLFNRVVCKMCKHDFSKASRSPWPKKQRFSLRNRITKGTKSLVAIHFPSSSSH